MQLQSVHIDDVVKCRVRGLEFYALVRDRDEHGLDISVIDRARLPRGLFISRVTARQVIAHWRKSRAKTSAQRRAERETTERAVLA